MTRVIRILMLSLAVVCGGSLPRAGAAALGLPKLPVPEAPALPLPGDGPGAVSGLRGEAKRLLDARELRRVRLVRQDPKRLERDPNGAPIVRAELLGVNPTDEAVARARDA